jgi:putative FmdB family regulatory protein
MAIYDAKCSACGKTVEYIRSIAQMLDTPVCECGTKMTKVILKAPPGFVDNPAFMQRFKKMYNGDISG